MVLNINRVRIFLLEERLGKAQLPPAAQPRTHSPFRRSYSISSAADTATVGDQEKKVQIELTILQC